MRDSAFDNYCFPGRLLEWLKLSLMESQWLLIAVFTAPWLYQLNFIMVRMFYVKNGTLLIWWSVKYQISHEAVSVHVKAHLAMPSMFKTSQACTRCWSCGLSSPWSRTWMSASLKSNCAIFVLGDFCHSHSERARILERFSYVSCIVRGRNPSK